MGPIARDLCILPSQRTPGPVDLAPEFGMFYGDDRRLGHQGKSFSRRDAEDAENFIRGGFLCVLCASAVMGLAETEIKACFTHATWK